MVEAASNLESLSARLHEVRRRIERRAGLCNRSPEEITLIAVGKTHPAEILEQAIKAGAHDFGENRVLEAEGKIARLGRHAARWHLIGHLQANKARRAVALFDVIHSVDSVALARRLERLCAEERRAAELRVLIQVDLAGEATKSGINEDKLPELAAAIKSCERLRLTGLMTLPPFFEDAERARPFFRRLRALRDEMSAHNDFGERRGELSMGMSHDYEIAIDEGATMLRIGTMIFGARQPKVAAGDS